jgi:ubiquitin C-terminal hydrolase
MSSYDKYQLVVWPSEGYKYDKNPNSEEKDEQKFLGLSNQGATCYMNSLLQTLFMTPEFRDKIYRWQFNQDKHGDPKDCIPFQLQLLFSKLQLKKAAYIETTGLTKSFGWDLRESFQQHDVQEFCRVLFDAIEESVKETEQENMINLLYQGTMYDYVKCHKCQQESKREDKYLDLSLTVRNDFDKVYNDSVEKALANYIKPEYLSEDNQYFCENCNAKQDATKGLKFKSFPYILALQLKRFDLDYTTFQRIKLNDEVRFPQILNMNPFCSENPPNPSDYDIGKHKEEAKGAKSAVNLMKPELNVTPEDIDARQISSSRITGYDYLIEDDDKKPIKIDSVAKQLNIEKETERRKQEQQGLMEKYLQEGEYVYELFSIMIHSGSALGGHYYAYIKCFEDNRWYNFNDSTVREIEEKDIEKVYGGVSKGTSWGGSYAANAYLLMYRQVKPTNISRIGNEAVPRYILDEVEKQEQHDIKEAQERAEKYKSMQLRVYYKNDDHLISIKKDHKFLELKKKAKEVFNLAQFSDDDIRVRAFSVHNDVLQDIYDENKTIEDLNIWSYKTLAVETKLPEQEWTSYDPNNIVIKVLKWEKKIEDEGLSLQEMVSDADKVQIDKRSTVKVLMEELERKYSIPIENMKILKKPYMGHSSYAEVVSSRTCWDQQLSTARIFEGSVLLIEYVENPALKSKWQEELEREANRYTIRFNHPDDKPTNLGQIEYKHTVIIECNKTMKDLKDAISNKLKILADELLMRRGTKSGAEIKDLSLKLIHCNLMNNSIIHLERGKPSSPNEFRVYISIAELANSSDDDGSTYRFFDVMDTALNADLEVKKVKEELCRDLNKRYPSMQLNPRNVRLRERTTDRLSRALKSSDPLKNYTLYEQKKLSLQILKEEDTELSYNDMIVVVRKWSPNTWEISEPIEIIVRKHSTLHDFGEKLSSAFSIPHGDLEVAKISYTWHFSRLDLKTETFHRTLNSSNFLSQQPWYISMDGNLFL